MQAAATAKDLGNQALAGVVLLGAFSRCLDEPVETWQAVVEELVPPKFRELNVRAFQAGQGC